MTRYVVFHHTHAELSRFVADNGLPPVAPVEWAYTAETEGIQPWKLVSCPKVFGVAPTDQDIKNHWRWNGIEFVATTELQYYIPRRPVCRLYVVNGEPEHNGKPEERCTLLPGHDGDCVPTGTPEAPVSRVTFRDATGKGLTVDASVKVEITATNAPDSTNERAAQCKGNGTLGLGCQRRDKDKSKAQKAARRKNR